MSTKGHSPNIQVQYALTETEQDKVYRLGYMDGWTNATELATKQTPLTHNAPAPGDVPIPDLCLTLPHAVPVPGSSPCGSSYKNWEDAASSMAFNSAWPEMDAVADVLGDHTCRVRFGSDCDECSGRSPWRSYLPQDDLTCRGPTNHGKAFVAPITPSHSVSSLDPITFVGNRRKSNRNWW